MTQPRLSFACELRAGPLGELFADPAVKQTLVDLGAGVALGLLDLSDERARVVRDLNDAGVPVVAWLLLPEDQGYWFNANNATEAATRYGEFKRWTSDHGLTWAGIGIDIEPDMREIERLRQGEAGQVLPQMLLRALDTERLRRNQVAYNNLVTQIRGDGYPVESYQIPMIADERKAGSTLLQRASGLVDTPVDCEVFMLYTSFLGRLGPALLWSYAPEAQVVAVGSTGGGVEMGLSLPTLTWDAFARDLRLARCFTDDIFIFSLEGCVKQGFLDRLTGFDWDASVTPPSAEDLRRVGQIRKALQGVLWASAHPLLVAGGIAGAAWMLGRRRR